MKFAFIVTNLAGGGAEKAILKLSEALRQRGHDVHLVLLEYRVEHSISSGITVHVLTAPGQKLSKGMIGEWRAVTRLRRLMQKLAVSAPFDLIVSTLPFADRVALRAKLPRHWCRIANTLSAEIARLHDASARKARRRFKRYREMYNGKSLIAVSSGVAQDLRDALGLSNAHIERIYNPFDFAAMRHAAGQPAELPAGPYVLHIGRFSAQKRHDLLLDAWCRLDRLPHRLVLLTAPNARLQQMIDARGLHDRVLVAGFQSNPYPWIAGAKLLVLCSDHEGLPNVLIEALAVGTPVVSTDCPSGPREILGAALPQSLVPVGDIEGLVRGIEHALQTPPDVKQVDLSPYTAEHIALAYERLAQQGAP